MGVRSQSEGERRGLIKHVLLVILEPHEFNG